MQLESLLSFLAMDRRHSLVDGTPIPSAAAGSVLFADISGFTPLTESLTRMLGARRGAEELTRQLNRVYDALIRPVVAQHGSVIQFSGDAITCWFEGGGAVRDAALQALTSAFDLQTVMDSLERVPLPNGDAVHLSIKVSVASGVVRRFLVGDPDIMRVEVLAGKTVNRMAEGEHHAKRGEVVIDVATADLLSDVIDIAEWRQAQSADGDQFALVAALHQTAPPGAWRKLDTSALTVEVLRQWVLPALRGREDSSLTELRPTVALFAAFDGIDYDDDPDAESKLDSYVRWLQTVLSRYDGSLLQLSAGDKGSHFYAAFGAPIAHENNAARAAAAALELRKLPPELDCIRSTRIGIASGIARTGMYGGPRRRVYGVIGDEVNVAARLMTHAQPGMILLSERAKKALEGAFLTDELAPISVKGKQGQIAVFRLVGKVEDNERRAFRALVGRDAELKRLLDLISPVANGQPVGGVWVYGEAGIGKTHLIHALRGHLADSAAWYRFVSDALVHESLHAVMPVLYDYFSFYLAINDILKKKLFERRIDRLIRSLSDDHMIAALNEARWYLGALLGLRWQGSPYENADPHQRFERSLHAIDTLFQAESLVKPLVLHVQDAQWLDADSRTVVALWCASAARFPMAVVIDSRETDDDLIEGQHITRFPVRELDRAGVAALAAEVLNGAVSERAVAYLMDKASGNPFFTEQLALDLVERAALVPSDSGAWEMNENIVEDMPVNINAVLIARLDRLAAGVRGVVQVASVLGQEFEVPILEKMTDDDETILRQRVEQAAHETIWTAHSSLLYVFRHALLRDAAYSMQLGERLKALHYRAGETIERVHADNLIIKAPDLAYHYEKAGDFARAVRYLVKSADYMLSLHAHHEAVSSYERALKLAQTAGLPALEIAPIYEGMGDLHEAAGEYQPAFEDYATALDLLPADQGAWRTTLHRKKGQVLQKWGRYDEATEAYEAGLTELQNDLNPEEACQLYTGLSMITYHQGNLDDALDLAALGLSMAHMQSDQRNLAYALQTLGAIYWKKGDYQEALRLYNESLSHWQACKLALGLAGIHNNLGLLYHSVGDSQNALASLETARLLFEQVGNSHGLALVYDNLGQVYMSLGDEETAVDCVEKAVGILAKIGLSETQVFSGMWQAGIW